MTIQTNSYVKFVRKIYTLSTGYIIVCYCDQSIHTRCLYRFILRTNIWMFNLRVALYSIIIDMPSNLFKIVITSPFTTNVKKFVRGLNAASVISTYAQAQVVLNQLLTQCQLLALRRLFLSNFNVPKEK